MTGQTSRRRRRRSKEGIVVYQHINAATDILPASMFETRCDVYTEEENSVQMMERHPTKLWVHNFLLLLRLSVGSDRCRGDKSSVIFICGGSRETSTTFLSCRDWCKKWTSQTSARTRDLHHWQLFFFLQHGGDGKSEGNKTTARCFGRRTKIFLTDGQKR